MDGLIAYALSKKYVDGKTSGLATGMSWKGTKENISNLPQSGNQVGDLWHVNENGNEYAWDGSKWEALGSIGSSATVDSALSSTSENPVQNKIINAALSQKGTYSKPSGGIPKTDLATDVQTSLGKADTALQQHQSLGGYATETYVQQQIAAIPDELPTVTSSDNGKFLRVVSGAWAAQAVPFQTPRVAMASADTTPALNPNTFYVFPEMASLTLSLATPSDATIANEYHFCFNSGATATVLTLPASVLQPDGFTVEANMHYEISILEGAMTAQGWAVTA